MKAEVNIQDFKRITAKVRGLNKEGRKLLHGVLGDGAKDWVEKAVNEVPVDMGFLRNSIQEKEVRELEWEVTANATYAPYIEFGTITKVSVPVELAAYAMQFKGKGIYKTGGMAARPFFFHHRMAIIEQIKNDLKNYEW